VSRLIRSSTFTALSVSTGLFGFSVAAAVLPAVAGETASGAAVYAAHCAVCHGPEAAGIPGYFPSLHEQIVAFAKTPQGRDYLVMVVTTGLMGDLNVAGVTYRGGVMPAQSGLSEEEVAAALEFLASDRGKNAATPALAAADVTAARERHPDRSAQATRALRPVLPAQ
jgi:ubiquinol-cytochrome c reductase cytochrome c subunit